MPLDIGGLEPAKPVLDIAAIQTRVKDKLVAAHRTARNYEELSAADIANTTVKVYALEEKTTLTVLLQRKRKAEQREADKVLLETTYNKWVADGKPTTGVRSQDGSIGLGLPETP